MPRAARRKSESNIYHIMLRGINHQQIFEEAPDYFTFLRILSECKKTTRFDLYAYCLMGNHIHLLVKVNFDNLENIVKIIGSKYVYWYNVKYRRTGHLFQDRFKSEPVETERYFLTVLRYIHLNPIKAKLCKKPQDYLYSSYNQYLINSSFIDSDFLFDIIPKEYFDSFHYEESECNCLDIDETPNIRCTDDQAKELIYKYSKCKSVSDFQMLTFEEKRKYIKKICESGVSIRQASRLTGELKSVIERYLKS